jgi:hypothetical protein
MMTRRVSAQALRRTWRLPLAAGLSVAALAAAPGAAQAAGPDRGGFSITESFVDSEVCAPEGFAVDVTQTDSATFTGFSNPARTLARWSYTATISANGHTITERDRWQTVYYPDGSSRNVGLTVHIQGPGIVQLDAGQVGFNADGSISYIRGPHPQLLGQTFCFALLP